MRAAARRAIGIPRLSQITLVAVLTCVTEAKMTKAKSARIKTTKRRINRAFREKRAPLLAVIK
jgi:hypothetical protein